MSDTPCTPDQPDTRKALETALAEAERKAWDNLARYKFSNFGYWSSLWVKLNRIGGFGCPNPFRSAVHLARAVIAETAAGEDHTATEPLVRPEADPAVTPPTTAK